MALEHTITPTDLGTKETGQMINSMVLEESTGPMEASSLDSM